MLPWREGSKFDRQSMTTTEEQALIVLLHIKQLVFSLTCILPHCPVNVACPFSFGWKYPLLSSYLLQTYSNTSHGFGSDTRTTLGKQNTGHSEIIQQTGAFCTTACWNKSVLIVCRLKLCCSQVSVSHRWPLTFPFCLFKTCTKLTSSPFPLPSHFTSNINSQGQSRAK